MGLPAIGLGAARHKSGAVKDVKHEKDQPQLRPGRGEVGGWGDGHRGAGVGAKRRLRMAGCRSKAPAAGLRR